MERAESIEEQIENIHQDIRGLIMQQKVRKMVDKDEKCLQDLFVVDPQDDMEKIEARKEILFDKSYNWILDTKEYVEFTHWGNNGSDPSSCQLLWVQGHAGTGKTMLLIGIVRELLSQSAMLAPNVAHFFCQGTDRALNTPTAALRSLLRLLLVQQPHLIRHLQSKYRNAGLGFFHGDSAFIELANVFKSMLNDPDLSPVYFIVDAIDECEQGSIELIELITTSITLSDKVKWLVSSSPEIDLKISGTTGTVVKLDARSLEHPIYAYIDHKISILKGKRGYDEKIMVGISKEVRQRAMGSFLRVALVFKELEEVLGLYAVDMVRKIPFDLPELYDHIMSRIEKEKSNLQDCKNILTIISLAYRPLSLSELGVLAGLRSDVNVQRIVDKCGSFLTTKDGTVHLIHQSAKDYLKQNFISKLQQAGVARGHAEISRYSIDAMSSILRRNLYGLSFGLKPKNMTPPTRDPLAPIRYSCVHWVEHLCFDGESSEGTGEFIDDVRVFEFLKKHFLHWLESLSLLGKVSDAVLAIGKLLNIFRKRGSSSQLLQFLNDANKFVLNHRLIIEKAPLQTYGSALVFSPATNEINSTQWKERLPFVKSVVGIKDDWSTHQQTLEGQTLEGHSDYVRTLVLSPDSSTLASTSSGDYTVRLWDTKTSILLQTLEGHSDLVRAIVFSTDGITFATSSYDNTVRLWDAETGTCQQTLKGHSSSVRAIAFSKNNMILASASSDNTVRLWNGKTGVYQQTLEGHSGPVSTVAFSPDSKMLASASSDKTVRLWNTETGAHLHILKGHSGSVRAVVFSPDSTELASASSDHIVHLWDTKTGTQRQTLNGHSGSVRAVAFSPDGITLASASYDRTVRLWDVKTGAHVQTISASFSITDLGFSEDGQSLKTNYGLLRISSELASLDKFPAQSHSDSALLVDKEWLTLDGALLLWLPEDYRPTCVALSGETLILGHKSGGRLTFFQFEFSEYIG